MIKKLINALSKAFILLLFLAFANQSSAQKLSLSELINLNGKNYPKFESFVMSKGYNFFKTESNPTEDTYIFGYAINYSTNMSDYWIEYTIYKDSLSQFKTSISWQTRKKGDYQMIKKDLENNKFNYINTKNEEKQVQVSYAKGKVSALLFQKHILDGFGTYSLTYEVGISIKKM